MSGELGRASYELDADLRPLRRAMAEGRRDVDQMEDALDALTAVSAFTETALKRIKMNPNQATETRATASAILAGVKGISEESREAARQIDRIRISETQATESVVAGERIKRNVNDIGDEADRTRRKLERVQIAGGVSGRSGVGVGPFGSGFGRVGVMGTAIGAGVLTGPALGPALAGVLAATPVLAGAAVGALGTLALAFQGVGKAINGDKKAFDKLTPSAQEFVLTIRSLHGWFQKLKETAAGSLFPGLAAGLKSALSPGTMSAITSALRELGSALGGAGEMWGKYFGSALFRESFGPLMQSAARTITTLSDAALGLFDALGVLSRAAIPLTDWITRGIDRGVQLANAWLRAKESTGELGGAMDEAQVSIRLLGGLLGSLINVVGSLGQALYPVAKVAVRDLTDGLNGLAQILRENRETIRDVVSGALSAFVSLVKTARDAVAVFWPVLSKVSDLLGGWQKTFELLIAMRLGVYLANLTGSFQKLAAAEALGGAASLSGTLLSNLTALKGLGLIAVAVALNFIPQNAPSSNPNAPSNNPALKFFAGLPVVGGAFSQANALADWANGKLGLTAPASTPGGGNTDSSDALSRFRSTKGGHLVGKSLTGVNSMIQSGLNALKAAGYDVNVTSGVRSYAQQAALYARYKASGFDPSKIAAKPGNSDHEFGNAVDVFINGKPAYSFGKDFLAKFGLVAPLGAKDNVHLTALGGPGQQSAFGTPPPFDKNLGSTAKPAIPTGAALLSQKMRDALANAQNRVLTAGGPKVAARWMRVELDLLEKARDQLEKDLKGSTGKKRAAIKDELRNIDREIAQVNRDIASNLKEQAKAVKQSFSGKLSNAKSNIMSAASLLKATLGAQFAAATQAQIDNVLGPRFYQGTDERGMQLMTPLERQLADMQAADALKQLQDAVAGAETPEERAAAQRQLDMYNLSIAAAAERAQADYDYAEAVKKYQAERAELEREMNLRLDNFANGLSDGTTQLGDLNAIVTEFGLSLSADDGVIQDFATLGDAVKALSLVLAQEASKLAGAGDKKGAKAAQDIIDRIGINTGLGQFRGAIPMADGGIGSVSMPTLFLAGEAGYEEFAFSGAGGSLADRFSSGGDGGEYAEVRSFANELDLAIWIGKKLKAANKSGIKFAIA